MRRKSPVFQKMMCLLFLALAFSSAQASSVPDPKKALAKWAAQKDVRREADPAGVPIQRRIKILTDGRSTIPDSASIIDSPDPSMVQAVEYPNQTTRYRIGFTGTFFIETENPADFYRGGVFTIQHTRSFYPDGTEMEIVYDGSASPWDVVLYKNAQGKQIAFGGVMEQTEPGELPGLENNPTRSRWWGEVRHEKTSNGTYEEHVLWKTPLHDFNREPRESIWEGHGYGGTLLTRFDPKLGIHTPERLANGNYLLFYERVAKQKNIEGRGALPWITTLFSRELNSSLTDAVGEEFLSTQLKSPITGKYFRAAERGDDGENGYLAEGASVLREIKRNQLIKSFSANEFTGRYGIYLDYLPPGADPRETFRPVMDKKGELFDFASTLRLREIIRGTWVGRPVLEYAPDGKLWLRFHFVPIDVLPPGAPHEGLPPYELWGSYPRFIAQVPVRIQYDKKGQPLIKWDLDPEFQSSIQPFIETEPEPAHGTEH